MSGFAEVDEEIYAEEELPVLPVPAGGEGTCLKNYIWHSYAYVSFTMVDWDGAGDAKGEAAEAKASNNYDHAVNMYTKAMELGGASAMTLANRADCLLKMKRPMAALSDCDEALKMNPDSAKALRFVSDNMFRTRKSNIIVSFS